LADLADSVPVPTVWFSQLLSEPNHQHWVTGTSFCDGDRLANSAQQSAWVDAGAVVRSWHSTDVQNWPTHGSHPDKVDQWVAQISDRAQEIGLINTSVAKAFSQAASFSSPSNRKAFPIHGDLTEDCVFHDGTEVSGLVNLGDSGIGDPAYDIATLTLWRPDQVEAVVSGYGTIAETDDFETGLRKFRLIRLLVGAEWLHTQGFSPAPYLSELYERLLAG
jgi:aminoglycoside phosphotransferase (APT) family kinase protein